MGNAVQHQLGIENKQEVKKPRRWHVLLLNDDFTPMDFVVDILVHIFNHTEETASIIMLKVHNEGKAIAGTYIWEIAETKADYVMQLAIQNEYPLQVAIEPAEEG